MKARLAFETKMRCGRGERARSQMEVKYGNRDWSVWIKAKNSKFSNFYFSHLILLVFSEVVNELEKQNFQASHQLICVDK